MPCIRQGLPSCPTYRMMIFLMYAKIVMLDFVINPITIATDDKISKIIVLAFTKLCSSLDAVGSR